MRAPMENLRNVVSKRGSNYVRGASARWLPYPRILGVARSCLNSQFFLSTHVHGLNFSPLGPPCPLGHVPVSPQQVVEFSHSLLQDVITAHFDAIQSRAHSSTLSIP